jgi:hypothetical protein
MTYGGASYSATPYSGASGTPGIDNITASATGWVSTALGTPGIVPAAVGFSATALGIPSISLVATGFSPAAYGTPVGKVVYPPESLGIVTNFGTPIADVDQTAYAQGFSSTRFSSWVYGVLGPPPAARSFAVSGFKPITFGTPVGKASQTTVATGFVVTYLGAPVSVRIAVASGFATTAFGTAKQVTKTYGAGFSATRLGTPASSRTAPATSVYRATRFGLPVAVRSNCYYPYGLYSPARFGQPKVVADLHTESGFTGTTFGTPAMQLRYRALHIPPVATFGKPLAQRTPLC